MLQGRWWWTIKVYVPQLGIELARCFSAERDLSFEDTSHSGATRDRQSGEFGARVPEIVLADPSSATAGFGGSGA